MDECEIVGGLFLPSDEEAACAVGPRVGPFDDPAPRLGVSTPSSRSGLAFDGNVRLVASPPGGRSNCFGVVPFVGAEMLPLARRRLRTLYDNLGGVEASPAPTHGRSHLLTLTLPSLGAVFLKSTVYGPESATQITIY
jgi:hypothetical protein